MPQVNEVSLKINQTVTTEDGESRVRVWFGPLEPGILYHIVCLSPERTQGYYCEERVNLSVVRKMEPAHEIMALFLN